MIYLKHRRSQFQFSNKYSYLFDGIDEFINTVDMNELDGLATMTVSAWIKISTLAIHMAIVVKWDYATQGSWAFQTDATNSDELIVFIASSLTDAGGADRAITTAANLVAGTWYHVAFVYNGNGATEADKLKIYVNGVVPAATNEGTVSASLTSASSTVKIGKFGGTVDRFFNGNIDEVGIFKTNLTSSQISEIYNNGKPKNLLNHSAKNNLVSYYRMGDGDTWDGTNWTAIDKKGTNNGTSVNMEFADNELDVPA